MKNYIIGIIFLFLSVFILDNCKVNKKGIQLQTVNHFDNLLADYGQSIYERESCSSCHTQLFDNGTAEIVSLDGLGNKYSNMFLTHLLIDPKTIFSDAIMPSFTDLFIYGFDNEILENSIKGKNYPNIGIDSLRKY